MNSVLKFCTGCAIEKPTEDFYKRQVRCKKCCSARGAKWRAANKESNRAWQKNYHLERKYGLTTARYLQMVAEQDGKCGLCGNPPGGTKQTELVVDHDHETNKVRMLLCYGCNIALGLLGDDPARIRAAADYVELFRE